MPGKEENGKDLRTSKYGGWRVEGASEDLASFLATPLSLALPITEIFLRERENFVELMATNSFGLISVFKELNFQIFKNYCVWRFFFSPTCRRGIGLLVIEVGPSGGPIPTQFELDLVGSWAGQLYKRKDFKSKIIIGFFFYTVFG